MGIQTCGEIGVVRVSHEYLWLFDVGFLGQVARVEMQNRPSKWTHTDMSWNGLHICDCRDAVRKWEDTQRQLPRDERKGMPDEFLEKCAIEALKKEFARVAAVLGRFKIKFNSASITVGGLNQLQGAMIKYAYPRRVRTGVREAVWNPRTKEWRLPKKYATLSHLYDAATLDEEALIERVKKMKAHDIEHEDDFDERRYRHLEAAEGRETLRTGTAYEKNAVIVDNLRMRSMNAEDKRLIDAGMGIVVVSETIDDDGKTVYSVEPMRS